MTITRRIAAGFALAAAPAVIFLGAATAHAEAAPANAAASVSHPAFPHQSNFPKPGTPEHHHHQKNHK